MLVTLHEVGDESSRFLILGEQGGPVEMGVGEPISVKNDATRLRAAAVVISPEGGTFLYAGDWLRATD